MGFVLRLVCPMALLCTLWNTDTLEEVAEMDLGQVEMRIVGKSQEPCPIFAELVGTSVQLTTTVTVSVR